MPTYSDSARNDSASAGSSVDAPASNPSVLTIPPRRTFDFAAKARSSRPARPSVVQVSAPATQPVVRPPVRSTAVRPAGPPSASISNVVPRQPAMPAVARARFSAPVGDIAGVDAAAAAIPNRLDEGSSTGSTAAPRLSVPTPSGMRFSFANRAQANNHESMLAAVEAATQAQDKVVGMLTDLRMYNDWGLGKVLQENGRRVSVKGQSLAGLVVGTRYQFSGKLSVHEKYGPQLDVLQVAPDMDSLDAIISHMARNYKNVGMTTAKRMAEHHRDVGTLAQLKDMLIHQPSLVDFSAFTSKEVALRDDEESANRRVEDSLSIRFSGLGIARSVMRSLGQWLFAKAAVSQSKESTRDLVSMANEILDENPYEPIGEVERYAFGTADLLGRKIGIAMDDPKRIVAIVLYALEEGCAAGGHMFLTEQQFFEAIHKIDPGLNPVQAMAMAIERGASVVVDSSGPQLRYYTRGLRRAETNLVHHITARITQEVEPLASLEGDELDEAIHRSARMVGYYNDNPDFELDETQFAALRGILTSRCSLHTLTGGPGCGKTAIVEVLMEFLAQNNRRRTTFCAPIGKAAKVLSSRIKRWGCAKTIHSTLEFQGDFKRNADNPLESDFVVADEQSMLDGAIGAALFDAVPAKAHILMLGDPDQLAAIAPGRVLKSVLEVNSLDHHCLSTTHRNSGPLLELIKMTNAGNWPSEYKQADMTRRMDEIGTGRLTFKALPEPTAGVFTQLAAQIKADAVKYGGLDRVGVICPKRRGNTSTPDWNVTYMNAALRDVLNPDPAEEKKVAGSPFRLEDRIIVGKNMMLPTLQSAPGERQQSNSHASQSGRATFDEEGATPDEAIDDEDEIDGMLGGEDGTSAGRDTYVVNGDTGWLESAAFDYEDGVRKVKSLTLRLDDGRKVIFPGSEMDNLALAYVITVHAAQGSEYGKVYGIVTPGHEQFMHRAMVMTEFSRGKQSLEVMGDSREIAKIVARPAPYRNCALAERVMAQVAEDERLADDVDPRARPAGERQRAA